MKPILFNTPMVQAILDGRKTMTRRVVKFKFLGAKFPLPDTAQFIEFKDGYAIVDIEQQRFKVKMPYQDCDTLYVRETWLRDEYGYQFKVLDNGHIFYDDGSCKWKPSIHMPKEAARIFLRVTGVRVERLQDITEEDAKSEGVKDPYEYQEPGYYDQPHFSGVEISKCAFAGLWDSLSAKRDYGWDANPWVWVYEFERCEKPEC